MSLDKLRNLAVSFLMGIVMVYGMEVYNKALLLGGLTEDILLSSLILVVPLGIVVVVLETFVGGRVAGRMMSRHVPDGEPRIVRTVFRGVFTCVVMCPMMSMVAMLLFKHPGEHVLVVWIQTTCLNFPMALSWQLFVAGPLVRKVARLLAARRAQTGASAVTSAAVSHIEVQGTSRRTR